MHQHHQLWFDVGKETYTTTIIFRSTDFKLWFDVGKETYTTDQALKPDFFQLWFDVGKETYTTNKRTKAGSNRLWFDVGKETYTTVVGWRRRLSENKTELAHALSSVSELCFLAKHDVYRLLEESPPWLEP